MQMVFNLAECGRSLAGGALIGLSATLFYWTHGRVAGISGLVGALFLPGEEARGSKIAFVVAMILGGVVCAVVRPEALSISGAPSLLLTIVAGVLVGVGTHLGNGCTSGHGVCGISRGSIRSIVATLTFMLTAFITVYVVRHIFKVER